MPWLRLIRWKNLLIIFLTQLLAWWCVVVPDAPFVPDVLNLQNFLLISASTLLIAAAGYIINDYFDIKTDAINKPYKVVLETVIPRKQAIIAHTALNIFALILAGIVAVQAHHPEWVFLQLSCTLLLWFYSTDFKRQYITGNVAISLLTALTLLILILYEPTAHPGGMPLKYAFSDKGYVLLFYAYFAFMLTWMREIVKDMEDQIGDEKTGCMTMPIKRGLQYSANFTLALAAVVIISLVVVSLVMLRGHFWQLPLYFTLLLLIPLLIWCFRFSKRSGTNHYHTASSQLKIIMLSGICSLIIYHLEFR